MGTLAGRQHTLWQTHLGLDLIGNTTDTDTHDTGTTCNEENEIAVIDDKLGSFVPSHRHFGLPFQKKEVAGVRSLEGVHKLTKFVLTGCIFSRSFATWESMMVTDY